MQPNPDSQGTVSAPFWLVIRHDHFEGDPYPFRYIEIHTHRYCLRLFRKRWAWPYLYFPRWMLAGFGAGPFGAMLMRKGLP